MLFDQAYARPRPHMRQLFVDSIEEEVGEGQAMPYGGEMGGGRTKLAPNSASPHDPANSWWGPGEAPTLVVTKDSARDC